MRKTPKAPRIKLHITAEMIESAKTRDVNHCMIAESVKVAYPDATKVAVDVQTIRFSDLKKGYRFTYLTPRTAQVHLIQWDRGGVKPEPFSFQIRNGQVTRAGNRPAAKAGNPKGTGGIDKVNEMRKARLIERKKGAGNVMDRVGGKTPPSDVPFSRRRAFGLRALEY